MRHGMTMVAGGLILLAGCATDSTRHGASGPIRYARMSCPRLDRERRQVEQATNRLFLSLRKRRAFGDRAQGEVLAMWPTLLFLRGPTSPDALRLKALQADYETLRGVAAGRNCPAIFAASLSATVAGGNGSPATRRINTVVREETQP